LFSMVKKYGIKYQLLELPGKGGNLVYFDLEESNPYWKEVATIVKRYGATDTTQTFFSDAEIMAADWVRLVPNFEQGYPQPKQIWFKSRPNYENFCQHCGTYRQVGSYRIRSEPQMKNNQFVSLIGTYAVFCTHTVLDEFKSHNFHDYLVWEVILHSTNLPSRDVKQIYIPKISRPGLVGDDLSFTTCPSCKEKKYSPHMRGIMSIKRDSLDSKADFCYTDEWFGSGGQAYREILISNRVARLITERKWRGVQLKVVEIE